MTRARTLLRLSLVLSVASTAVGLVTGDGPVAVRVGAFVFSVALYGGLWLLTATRPKVVAITAAVLSAIGATANVISPTFTQIVIAVMSAASVLLAAAAYRQLRGQDYPPHLLAVLPDYPSTVMAATSPSLLGR